MSSTSLSSLSSEDGVEPVRRIRTLRDRSDPFTEFSDINFKMRFRFSKNTVMELLHIIGPVIEPFTKRNKSLSAAEQILITLRFYATGAFQQVIGDTFNVQKSTICKVIRHVTPLIARLKERYIKMPNEQREIASVVAGFHAIANLPCVIGAVDCTHIRISSPGGNNAELFRNRKGYFSINVQIVSDAQLKIMHIIARWPGSVHDSTIFNDSPLAVDFERNTYGNNFLLGDSGYPCRKYLLTPLLHPQTPAEEAYNIAHIRTRNTVERCFGVLKRRFSCLHVGMALKLDRVLSIIVACSVLHNLAIEVNDMDLPGLEDADVNHVMMDQEIEAAFAEGRQNDVVRRAIINNVFGQ